jgi:fibronectin type 3 domain-containing protein
MLNAAVLRVDVTLLGASPLNAKTTDAGGPYNPFAANAPLTLFATGIRNAYDMAWLKGKLYVATNGSAAGGSTPGTPAGSYSFGVNQRIDFAIHGAYTGPDVPALSNVQQTQNDYIFHVVQGGYYGHPNPVRGEFVMNGGNPTAGVDPNEVPAYPVGTLPDRNYRGNNTGANSLTKGTAYVYGKNYSPDGIIAYKNAGAFSGLLKDKLLVAEYSGGDAIGVLTVDANTNITKRQTGIAGLTHFVDPLDLTENPATGFLYVAEYGGQQLILVRPITPGANLSTDKSKMVFNDTTATGASPQQKITITNTGTTALAFPTDGLTITGTNASQFAFVNKPNPIPNVNPGDSLDLFITFTANSVGDIKTANLQLKSNDEDQMTINIPLRGLGTGGTGGVNEPSLQKIMDLHQIPITVGDNNPADVTFPEPPITPNNELVMPLLVKDGPGEVAIESLAVFGVGNATIPTFHFGYYKPGNRQDTTPLFKSVGTAQSQTVDPQVIGATTFDPGENPFGIYTWWQNFQQQPTVYSEDALNKSYDATEPRKVRFYPLKTAQGVVVPNAYIFAFEEFNNSTDMQDFVGIIRNVKAAPAGPELGLENLDGIPFSDRLVFNKIENANNSADGKPNNIFHGLSTVRIRNTGSQPLMIDSLVISSGWQIEGVPATPFTIAAGGQQDVKVRFVANPGGSQKLLQGTLTINSNDADEPATQIQLAGHWQPRNERGNEPPLASVVQAFGWTTNIPTGSGLNQGGRITRVAEEVLSPYWKRADQTLPVSVRQLAAYHTQGSSHNVQYFTKGSSTNTTIFTHDGDEGQSFLPHKEVAAVGTVGVDFAAGTFTHTGTFGFRIESESSDPTKNVQEQPGGNYGHHVRFFVVRDRDGKIVPNVYIMTMDFSGINYDYQDNIYLVSNVIPESPPSTPTGLAAVASGAGIALSWNDNTEPNLAGYNVYRSNASGGTYTKINSTLILASDFNDVAAPIGTSYYKVTAVDTAGNESLKSVDVNGNRTNDTTPPPVPTGLTAVASANSIQLNWSNSPAGDFKGFNVYRSTTPGGPWGSPINVQLLTNSDFTDTSAPIGVVSYYYVTAVDQANNESGGATTSATRPSSDLTPPATPTIDSITPSFGGIALDWSDNQETDFAGYNIYRSPDGVNNWQKLNVTLLGTSFFNDTGAPTDVVSFYRVTAIDTSNNESQPATANATRPSDLEKPAIPTGLDAAGGSGTADLHWDDNTETDLAGYRVYRSANGIDGWTQINVGLLTESSYHDTTPTWSAINYYRVTAVDQAGNESDPATAQAFVSDGDTSAPFQPQNLVLTNLGAGGVSLNWDDNTELDLAGYVIERATSPAGPFLPVSQSLITVSSYTDTTAPASGTLYYRVSARDTTGNTSLPAEANITRTPAPANFTFTQIGNPSPAGSLTPVGDNGYNLVAGGTDIYNTADSFAFAHQQVTGNFDFKIRLAGLTNTNSFAKAGLMARESLAANSRNVFVLATPGSNGHRLTHRSTNGGSTTSQGSGPVSYPNNWLRLVRVGNTFQGYRSTNGVDWTLVGQVTNNNMPQTLLFGMAAVGRNATTATTAQFRDVPGATAPDAKPATPANLIVAGSQTGIDLNWDDNTTDSDLVGYNVYRSSSAGGTFTKLNGSPLVGSAYFDSTATAGQTSFYRVFAVDAVGQESEVPATGSALRPDPTPQTNIKLNFQLNGSAAVAGYDQDNGDVFGLRSNGLTYGFNTSHTAEDRDRNKNANQLLDTLVQMKANSTWSISLANGTYTVKLSVGDSQYTSNNSVTINGVTYWTNQALGLNQFAEKTMTVTVTNGKLVLSNAGGADRMTKLNFIEITSA